MIFHLVLRNIIRNKKNTVIVGLLIMLITALFFIGNTVIAHSNQGLRRTYVQNFTGDVVVQKKTDVTMSLFGANTPVIDEFFTIPTLPSYREVKKIVLNTRGVQAVTSQVSGSAVMDVLGERSKVPLIGVDSESYFELFPGIRLHDGSVLKQGRRGVMLTRSRVETIEKNSGKELEIGEPVKFTVSSESGFRIREAPLTGIFSYRNPGIFMQDVVLADPQTVRSLNAILLAENSAYKPPEEATDSLTDDVDSLFADGEGEKSTGDANGEAPAPEEERGGISIEELNRELSAEEEDAAAPATWEGGSWHFIILRTAEGASPGTVMSRLNKKLDEYGATAVDWRTAAGTSALLVLMVQVLFNIGFILVAIAGTIAIVNILLIAVFRRTREIGTLRAIGASDGYIRTMILSENLIITFIAGLLGLAIGILTLQGINAAEIEISNRLIVSLLGQRVIEIGFSLTTALWGLAAALALGLAASIYPVQRAIGIQPIVAVREI